MRCYTGTIVISLQVIRQPKISYENFSIDFYKSKSEDEKNKEQNVQFAVVVISERNLVLWKSWPINKRLHMEKNILVSNLICQLVAGQ